MTFTLSEELARKAGLKLSVQGKTALELPRAHRVNTQDTSKQNLNAFSESTSTNQLEAEGRVTQRADFQPMDSTAYMKLKQ